MLDPTFLRETAATIRDTRERIAVALATSDAAELYCCGGEAGRAVTAAIQAETRLAQAAALLDRAARIAPLATEPTLIATTIVTADVWLRRGVAACAPR